MPASRSIETTVIAIEPVGSGYRVTLDTAGNPAEVETI